MKKLVTAVIVILIIAGLCLPPVFGIVTENRVTERLADGGPNPYVKARIGEFERGLYSSTATLTLSLSDEYLAELEKTIYSSVPVTPEAAEQQEAISVVIAAMADGLSLDIKFTHGPVAVRDGLFFGLSQVTARIDSETPFMANKQEELGLPYLMEMQAQLEFDGSASFQGDIPSFSVSEADESFDFSGLDINGKFNAANRSVIAEVRIDSITGVTNEADFSVEGISLTTDSILMSDNFWLGDSNFQISNVTAMNPGDPDNQMVRLENAGFDISSTLNDVGDKAFFDLTYGIGLLMAADEMEIEDARFNFGLSGIDMEALRKYLELVRNMGVVTEQAMMESIPELTNIMYDVLAGSPSVTFNPVAFKFNGEAFNATLRIDVEGSALPPLQQIQSADPMILARILSGNARIDATESLASSISENIVLGQIRSGLPPEVELSDEEISTMAKQQIEMMLTSFIQQGMLKQEAGQVTSTINYANGELIVNGNVIPLGITVPGQVP